MRNKILAAVLACCMMLALGVTVSGEVTPTLTATQGNIGTTPLTLAASSAGLVGADFLYDANTLVWIDAVGVDGEYTLLVVPYGAQPTPANIQFIDQGPDGDFRFRLRNANPGDTFRVSVGGTDVDSPTRMYFRVAPAQQGDGPDLRPTSPQNTPVPAVGAAPGAWTGTGFFHLNAAGTNAFHPFPLPWLLGTNNGYARISIALQPHELDLPGGLVWRGYYDDGAGYRVQLLWSPERQRFDALIRNIVVGPAGNPTSVVSFDTILSRIEWEQVPAAQRRTIRYGMGINTFYATPNFQAAGLVNPAGPDPAAMLRLATGNNLDEFPAANRPPMSAGLINGHHPRRLPYPNDLTKRMQDILMLDVLGNQGVTGGSPAAVLDRATGVLVPTVARDRY